MKDENKAVFTGTVLSVDFDYMTADISVVNGWDGHRAVATVPVPPTWLFGFGNDLKITIERVMA